jgi:hypothetical protein
MKKIQIIVAAVLCGMVLNATAQNALKGFGTVVRVEGIASYSLGDNAWHPLLTGKRLPVGSTIRTGQNGVVDVVLGKEMPISMAQTTLEPNGLSYAPSPKVRGLVNYKPSVEQNVVRVTPNSVLSIDKLTITDTGADTVSDTELNLKQGKIYASVKKLSGASQYLVKIPNGVAGVRGTLFSISADGSISCFDSESDGVTLSLVVNGETKTFNVPAGTMLGAGGISMPIPAEGMSSLKELFDALKSIFGEQVIEYSQDHTQIYISPTQGAN